MKSSSAPPTNCPIKAIIWQIWPYKRRNFALFLNSSYWLSMKYVPKDVQLDYL